MMDSVLGRGPNNIMWRPAIMSPWLLVLFGAFLFLMALYYPLERTILAAGPICSTGAWPDVASRGPRDLPGAAEVAKESEHYCKGRWIYMYELPREFNEGLLERCRRREAERQCKEWDCVPCERLGENGGLGPLMSKRATANGSRAGGGSGPVELVPRGAWYETDQFAAEVIFHQRMKGYECLTKDPGRATAFYVPFYAGADVAFTLFSPHMQLRDELTQRLLGWLSGHPAWRLAQRRHRRANSAEGAASAGASPPRPSDHFLVLSRIAWDFDRLPLVSHWGTSLLHQPDFQHVTTLSIERKFMDYRDMGIPYPTSFHPSSMADLRTWQEAIKMVQRSWLVTFLGASSRKFSYETMKLLRVELIDQCSTSNGKCRAIECDDNLIESSSTNMDVIKCSYEHHKVINALATSTFCLQPGGDSATRRGFFDTLVAGCIPVVFAKNTAYEQYLWHLPSLSNEYSVFINEDDVVSKRVNVIETLSRIPLKKRIAMQKAVRELIPRITYSAIPNSKSLGLLSQRPLKDAFDLTLHAYLDQLNGAHM